MEEGEPPITLEISKIIAKNRYPQFENHRFKETHMGHLNYIDVQICLNILWTYRTHINELDYDIPLPIEIKNIIPTHLKIHFEHYEYEVDPDKNNWYIWYHLCSEI